MDLMSVYIKCNDKVSLLVLEQDWWKSFYRLNRFARNSNFSEQPVRALNLSTDAKQKIKENLTLYCFRCETIVVCGKIRPKKKRQVFQKTVPWKVLIAKRITFAIQFFHVQTWNFSTFGCLTVLLRRTSMFFVPILSPIFCDLASFLVSY